MIEDLVTQDPDHVKGLLGSDRVDEHVPMNANEVLRIQDAVFILKQRPAWGLSVSPAPADRCTKPGWGEGVVCLPDQPCR